MFIVPWNKNFRLAGNFFFEKSALRGLLGRVFPKLRAVCVNSTENLIYVCFYIDGEISEDEAEYCEGALDDIIADFCHLTYNGKDIEFETPIVRLDYPQKPSLIGHWVYYRDEQYQVI